MSGGGPIFRVMTEEEIANADTMIVARCAALVMERNKYRRRVLPERQCANYSAFLPQSMLLDSDGEWYCNRHLHWKNPL